MSISAAHWLQDAPGASGGGMSDALPQVQRIVAYATACLENPILGQGLESIDARATG
jgi:hypothetical protein